MAVVVLFNIYAIYQHNERVPINNHENIIRTPSRPFWFAIDMPIRNEHRNNIQRSIKKEEGNNGVDRAAMTTDTGYTSFADASNHYSSDSSNPIALESNTVGFALDMDSGTLEVLDADGATLRSFSGITGHVAPLVRTTNAGDHPHEWTYVTVNFGQGGQAGLAHRAEAGGRFAHAP